MELPSERRKFLLRTLQSAGLAAMGGLVWGAYMDKAQAARLVLRPPGAIPEEAFQASCIKCGMCVSACPFDTLMLARPGDEAPLGTPYFIPRDIPCEMCEDVPCVPVCPTGSLDENLVSEMKEGNKEWNINKAQMGLAVVDEESCIAFWGIQCDACYRVCPVLDEAITLEYRRNHRTGKHSFLLPIVHSDKCTGCGKCERACVTEKAAIYVLPREVAMGQIGGNYIIGWDDQDEQRLKDADTDVTTTTERSKKSAVDYLNETEF